MAYADHYNPADALAAIIAAGVARYQESLPDYAQDAVPFVTLPDHARPASEIAEPEPNVSAVNEARQLELCLNCLLPECLGIESPMCPIRITQRAEWRKQQQTRRRNLNG